MNSPHQNIDLSPAMGRSVGLAAYAMPTLGEYFSSILARKWFVILLTLLSIAVSIFVVQRMTPIYESTAALLLESGTQQVVSIEELYSGAGRGREFTQTQVEFMQSREVRSRVVDALGLDRVKAFDPRQKESNSLIESAMLWLRDFEILRPYIPVPQGSENGLGVEPLTEEEIQEIVLAQLQDATTITPVRLSQLVKMSVESSDRILAARIANEMAQAYITADLDARFAMQQNASRWLNERLANLKENLENSEKRLQDYREQLGLIATPQSSMGGNVVQLDGASTQLVSARAELAQVQQIYRQVRRGARNRYQVPEVFNNAAVASARGELNAAQVRLNEAKRSLGEAHPSFIRAKEEFEAAQGNYVAAAESVISSIQKRFEVARSTVRALESEIQASRGDIQEINRKEGQLTVLEREVATNEEIYQTFLARVKETDATSDFRTPIARVVDPATPALTPSKPRKAAIVLLSGLVGGLLACLLAIALEQRNAAIRSTDDVDGKLGLPMIAAAPKVPRNQQGSIGVMQLENPTSVFSEAVRTAVTGISLAMRDIQRPIIGFTSALPSEGKSTIAVNFALEAARTRKVLLIDGDLRKPAIHAKLGIGETKLGLAELYRDAPTSVCVQKIERDDVSMSVLFSGAPPKNPLDMLMNERFSKMIAELRGDYDLIVIDTPPLELVSDALPIGQICDGMVLVVRASDTPIPMIRRVSQRIMSSNIHLMGVMLNGHDFSRAGKYYGEYSALGGQYGNYGGYYGYGGGQSGVKSEGTPRADYGGNKPAAGGWKQANSASS